VAKDLTMARSTWLEVALNGPWPRQRQRHVPVSVAEIVADGIACVEAGASILHIHARDEESGRQVEDADTYAAIIEGIRARVDAIIYPTIPVAGGPAAPDAGQGDGQQRFAVISALAERGLLEWSAVDPGSVNFALDEQLSRDRPGFVYLNPEVHIRTGLALSARHRLHPSYAIYEPGFMRLGAALARRTPELPQEIYRLMFTGGYRFGFPPRRYALEAYLELLAACAPGAPWMIAGLSVDVSPLIAETVARGGHVRVGLEDAALDGDTSNLELTTAAVRAIAEAGGRPASAQEVRDALGNK
jgi:3-keto-5-aminohexanoate cleavage enzyme